MKRRLRKELLQHMFVSSLIYLWTPFIGILVMGLIAGANNSNPFLYTMFLIFAFLTFVSAMIHQSVKIIKETKDDK